MANIVEIEKAFNNAILATGIGVNEDDIGATDWVKNKATAWTYTDGFRPAEDQSGEHLKVTINYNIEYVIGNEDTSDLGVYDRSVAAALDFEKIMSALYQVVGSTSADEVRLVDGDLRHETGKKYQSYGTWIIEFDYEFRVC